MRSLAEVGLAVAGRRKAMRLKQGYVAEKAGVSVDALSRLERGVATEYGVGKLLRVLAVLEAELDISDRRLAGTLDELRRERGGG